MRCARPASSSRSTAPGCSRWRATPHGLEWFDLVFAELRELGFEGGLDPLGPSEARELEPALGRAARHAVHATIDRHVDPASLTTGLAAHLAASGATVTTGFAVRAIGANGRGWRVFGPEGRFADGDAVVVSAAIGSTRLLRPHGLDRAARRRQGLLGDRPARRPDTEACPSTSASRSSA